MIFSRKKAAQNYNAFAEDFSETRQYQWPEFKFFENYVGEKVLDIGCGNGRASEFFQKTGAKEIVGLDNSEELLKIAHKNYPQIKFVQGSMENPLPFDDKYFNAVFLIASFHHLINKKERKNTLQETYRILKNDGYLIITAWNLFCQEKYATERKKAKIRSLLLPFWHKKDLIIPFGQEKDPRYYYAFEEKELKNLLKDNFFEVIDFFGTKRGEKSDLKDAYNLCVIARKKNKAEICGVNFDLISKKEASDKLIEFSETAQGKMIFTPNPEMCVGASKNPEFRKILNQADLSLADGTGIIWAGQTKVKNLFTAFFSLLGFAFSEKKIGSFERSQGSDLFKKFCLQTNKKVFLLGGSENVAQKCGEYFKKKNPKFILAGADSGSSKEFDEQRIIEKINQAGAEVLFVAFGAPNQEKWIYRNLSKMPSVRFAMGVGGSFDFIAGTQKRAPKIFQKIGLEWLFRLIKEPKRFKRIWNATFVFVLLTIKYNRLEK